MAGYSGTPLARKLGIKPDALVATLRAPSHFPDLLDPLPDGVTIASDPAEPGSLDDGSLDEGSLDEGSPDDGSPDDGPGGHDVVVAFAPDLAALPAALRDGQRLLAIDGGLWIAWPKKSSGLHRDLDREAVREAGLRTGLVDNKVCAIDDDWSGLRFVYRLKDR